MVAKRLPRNGSDLVEEIEQKIYMLESLVRELINDIASSMQRNFESSGGCTKCLGRGWVVTWDTMDFMDGSCAEYAACPNENCTEETRAASGLHPQHNRYDYNRGVSNPVVAHPAYQCVVKQLAEQALDLRSEVYRLQSENRAFKKGDKVVVARGRKVPIGTLGRVAWISQNTGGILLKPEDKWQDRTADGVWVNPKNIERLVE